MQVEKSSYVWLPLLPRLDGQGYELVYADKWSPSDYKERARIPVVYNNGTEPEGISISNVPMDEGATGGGAAWSLKGRLLRCGVLCSALFVLLLLPSFLPGLEAAVSVCRECL